MDGAAEHVGVQKLVNAAVGVDSDSSPVVVDTVGAFAADRIVNAPHSLVETEMAHDSDCV